MSKPAENLLGVKLNNGWEVISRIELKPDQTKGYFSYGYKVKNDKGQEAFLKALDFHCLPPYGDQPKQIETLTNAFNYEVDILKRCKDRHMDKIILSLDSGSYGDIRKGDFVMYIIFEMAIDDIRSYNNININTDSLFYLKTLHDVAVGLQQLHSADIAHQDIKPANILQFDDSLKIGDLGRAISKDIKAPHDNGSFVGDIRYAPFEYFYKDFGSDWNKSNLGADSYMLGNLIVFLFHSGNNLYQILKLELEEIYHPDKWSDSYEKALPFIIEAFDKALVKIKESIFPEIIRSDLILMIKYLCNPDPNKRGDPYSQIGEEPSHNLERYITKFDVLSKKVKLELAKIK